MWPRLAETRLSSITPAGLLRRLARAGVADPTMLDNPDEALRQGYYFSPASAHYQAMFEVADDALQLPAGDVQDWIEIAPTERRPWLGCAALRPSAALQIGSASCRESVYNNV